MPPSRPSSVLRGLSPEARDEVDRLQGDFPELNPKTVAANLTAVEYQDIVQRGHTPRKVVANRQRYVRNIQIANGACPSNLSASDDCRSFILANALQIPDDYTPCTNHTSVDQLRLALGLNLPTQLLTFPAAQLDFVDELKDINDKRQARSTIAFMSPVHLFNALIFTMRDEMQKYTTVDGSWEFLANGSVVILFGTVQHYYDGTRVVGSFRPLMYAVSPSESKVAFTVLIRCLKWAVRACFGLVFTATYGACDRTDSFGTPFMHELCVLQVIACAVHFLRHFNGTSAESQIVKDKLFDKTLLPYMSDCMKRLQGSTCLPLFRSAFDKTMEEWTALGEILVVKWCTDYYGPNSRYGTWWMNCTGIPGHPNHTNLIEGTFRQQKPSKKFGGGECQMKVSLQVFFTVSVPQLFKFDMLQRSDASMFDPHCYFDKVSLSLVCLMDKRIDQHTLRENKEWLVNSPQCFGEEISDPRMELYFEARSGKSSRFGTAEAMLMASSSFCHVVVLDHLHPQRGLGFDMVCSCNIFHTQFICPATLLVRDSLGEIDLLEMFSPMVVGNNVARLSDKARHKHNYNRPSRRRAAGTTTEKSLTLFISVLRSLTEEAVGEATRKAAALSIEGFDFKRHPSPAMQYLVGRNKEVLIAAAQYRYTVSQQRAYKKKIKGESVSALFSILIRWSAYLHDVRIQAGIKVCNENEGNEYIPVSSSTYEFLAGAQSRHHDVIFSQSTSPPPLSLTTRVRVPKRAIKQREDNQARRISQTVARMSSRSEVPKLSSQRTSGRPFKRTKNKKSTTICSSDDRFASTEFLTTTEDNSLVGLSLANALSSEASPDATVTETLSRIVFPENVSTSATMRKFGLALVPAVSKDMGVTSAAHEHRKLVFLCWSVGLKSITIQRTCNLKM
jgi:hypothetical protein